MFRFTEICCLILAEDGIHPRDGDGQSDECSLGISENSGANFQVSQVSYPPLERAKHQQLLKPLLHVLGFLFLPVNPPGVSEVLAAP